VALADRSRAARAGCEEHRTLSILLVFCHPRRHSLTGAIADAFTEGAMSAGHAVEFADLYAEGFDPRLYPADEPDRENENRRYSEPVYAEMRRIARHDAIVLVFPVWWWSMPAMLKGWIERVFAFGFAHGPRHLAQRHSLALGVAAASAQDFAKRRYDAAMAIQIVTGILDYCGIEHPACEILHGSKSDIATRQALIAKARQLGAAFPARLDAGENCDGGAR
jgi:NAD(P)H dehydrogenase (quinone)